MDKLRDIILNELQKTGFACQHTLYKKAAFASTRMNTFTEAIRTLVNEGKIEKFRGQPCKYGCMISFPGKYVPVPPKKHTVKIRKAKPRQEEPDILDGEWFRKNEAFIF